jgi:hypothetical protein
MNLFRRMSTSHLLALCAAVVALGGGMTAIASALGGATPPKPQSLPNAVHQALTAPRITGLSADIAFTNHLVDSSSLVGRDPLLTGANGRLWVDPVNHRLRIELRASEGNDSQLMVDNGSFWFYDGASNTVYRGTLPQHSAGPEKSSDAKGANDQHQPPSVSEIQSTISRLSQHLNIGGAQPGTTANQGSYSVRVSPRTNPGLLGGVELAWDALHGVPLRVSVYAQNTASPVLELKATNISFSLPSDAFHAAAPPGAKTVNVDLGQKASSAADHSSNHTGDHGASAVTGLAPVQAKVPFQISAPDSLNGLARQEVRLLQFNGSPGALVTYGQGLGTIAVLERAHGADTAKPGAAPTGKNTGPTGKTDQGSGAGEHGNGLASLPTVQIGSATGHELATALGTVITFLRAGAQGGQVDYTVAGSVGTHAAEAAARAL